MGGSSERVRWVFGLFPRVCRVFWAFPVRVRVGFPSLLFLTSISRRPALAPMPQPKALAVASLAANRRA